MKKYVIRSIGWVFDDDWYNYDGPHEIAGVYDHESDAIERVDELNHRHFLSRVFISRRFQLNYGTSSGKEQFLDRNLLAKLIAKNIGVDVQSIYDPQYGFIWRDEIRYLKKLRTAQVKEILETIGLTFFTYVELSEENYFFYKVKRNPILWHRHMEEEGYGNPEHYYYLFDDRDADKHRLVSTRLEGYFYAVKQEYDPITWKLSQGNMISGSLEDLSKTPNLLEQIVKISENIAYDDSKQTMVFNKAVTPEELMSLDALLLHPILLLEKIPVASLSVYDEENTYLSKEIKKKYGR